MKYSTNYNLKKPEATDLVSISDLNENADTIDSVVSDVAAVAVELATANLKWHGKLKITDSDNSVEYIATLGVVNGKPCLSFTEAD